MSTSERVWASASDRNRAQAILTLHVAEIESINADYVAGQPSRGQSERIASERRRRALWDEEENKWALFDAMTFLAGQAASELAKVDPVLKTATEWLRELALENAWADEELRELFGGEGPGL